MTNSYYDDDSWSKDEQLLSPLPSPKSSPTPIIIESLDPGTSSPPPEVTSSSSSSSSSSDDDASSTPSVSSLDDPYSDVRDRLTYLAALDRQRHLSPDGHGSDAPVIPFFAALTTYLGYTVLIIVGHVRDLCACIFRSGRYRPMGRFPSDNLSEYAPLLKSWENFYTRRLYHRIQDCFNRPVASAPGATIDVLERGSEDGMKTMTLSSTSKWSCHEKVLSGGRVARHCLNLGSYNYLGFADDWNLTCEEEVLASTGDLPLSGTSSRSEGGTTVLHTQLEDRVARFLGKESAIVYNMGFNTNATTIPALVGRGDLLISDELNHTSIVNGARGSGAAIRTFRHNDATMLEQVLREAIVMGRPRMRRPFKKILVIVEGVYSMEGEYCNLKEIARVCKRYGAYLYLDEAHSIGAMGKTGRGISEYCGVESGDVDILMGTFSKSFGGMGGYIASSKSVIDLLRTKCASSLYHNSLSPIVCQQIITSFKVIMGEDNTHIGKQKLQSLCDNSNYFRMRLTEMGLHVLGNYDSPVMPIMLYNPTKIAAFSRECFKRGLAVVVVGFPAVPILMSRARFCISAGHTRPELDRALAVIEEVAGILKLRYAVSHMG